MDGNMFWFGVCCFYYLVSVFVAGFWVVKNWSIILMVPRCIIRRV